MMDLESEERRPLAQATVAVRGRTAGIGVLVAATWLVALPAAAMPVAAAATLPDGSAVVQVLTTCDTRGCFTFGPRQSFHRPNYQPLGRTGPGVESPGAARPPRFIFRPQAPRPLPQARLPAGDQRYHRQSCMSRYRSYDPSTDSYISSSGRSVRCVLPGGR